MAGEYQRAKRAINEAIESIAGESGMDEEIFARALMTQLLERYRDRRSAADIISELEEHIRNIEDDGNAVITRGC